MGLALLILFVGLGELARSAPANCRTQAIAALKISDLTVQSAETVAGTATHSAYCRVTGTVTTKGEGAPDGSANFEVRMPSDWNGKFFFYGVGGLGGSIPDHYDSESVVAKGYAAAVTDMGHQGDPTDARWALSAPGVPDRAKVADYFFRATHNVTVAAKQLVAAYYGRPVQRAYFGGCSNGGRMALMEAQRYPDDYDGIIAGAPFLDIKAVWNPIRVYKNAPPDFFIPFPTLTILDQAIYANCDAADGVKDGLIQNPAKCSFDPGAIVCKQGSTADCISPGQAEILKRYWSAIRDSRGRLIAAGMTLSDMGGTGGVAVWTTGAFAPDFSRPEPFGGMAPLGWQFSSRIMQNLVQYDPTYAPLNFDVSPAGVVGDDALKLFEERTAAGSPSDATKLQPFLEKGNKLLMYHGFSDPALSPYRTMLYYEQLAGLTRNSYADLQQNARLFMVPGMQHCSGGPGPDVFDCVSALDDWVSKGIGPERITATKFSDRRSGNVLRTMPLCKFPEQATYKGSGDVNDGGNWQCGGNTLLVQSGPVGKMAGWK